jgi:predicted nucleic acid-binding protein
MTSRILIDANVFMYATGTDHPLKAPSLAVLELATEHQSFFTNAEVFQEILHRHISQRRWDAVKATFFFDQMELMESRIEPVFAADVLSAAELAGRYPNLSARDLIHVAIAVRAGATHIVSADAAFDGLAEVQRLDPLLIDRWRGDIAGSAA